MDDRALLDTLPATSRLALAYAPRAARSDWLTLLAFDARLAGIVRAAREPLPGQMRIAWWRDRLGEAPALWPNGEPQLAHLRDWDREFAQLAALVDAWEPLLGEPPIAQSAFRALAEARVEALAALARRLEVPDDAVRVAGWDWALADVLARLSDPTEREAVAGLMQRLPAPRLPRAMRPLAVVRVLALRNSSPLLDLFAAVRVGLFGR